MYNYTGKVWGDTCLLFDKNNVEIHRITIKAGGFCSKHRHCHKYNAFFVESGELEIKVWKNDYKLCDQTVISSEKGNRQTIVAPGEYHLFKAQTDVIAYEIYWTELRGDDIERENCGGMVEGEEKK